MRVAGGIASGMSRKGAEMNNPSAENVNDENTTPTTNKSGFTIEGSENGMIIMAYAMERIKPKKNPARTLPSVMVNNETGAARSLSNVPALLSKGNATASIAPAPNKAAIATKPGKTKEGVTGLPIAKAKYRTTGRINPNIIFGHLKKYIFASLIAM